MFEITAATEKEIPVIQMLAQACYMIAYRGIHSEEQNRFMMESMYATESLRQQMRSGSRFFLIFANQEPAGYCAIKPVEGEPDVTYLDKLYVLPDLKQQGLGRALIDHVVQEALLQHGKPFTLRLDVNRSNPSIGFYRHLGFEGISEWDAPIGHGFYMNALTMEKRIGLK